MENPINPYHPQLLFGSSNKMEKIRAVIDQVAKTDITVLIRGESGTGKELIAKTLFSCSARIHQPFVKVLCAAIPDGLLESELFGHEKGSFTGAHRSTPGKFEFANHGTIFLDEIGDIPYSLQAKMLQVLQDGEFSRLGGTEVKVDVRVVAATHKDLAEAVRQGTFREDLFYRLNVVTLHLPPLRERKEDIPQLTDLFLEKYSRHFNREIQKLSIDQLRLFMDYDWPGNVRELENLIKRMVILGNKDRVIEKFFSNKKKQEKILSDPFHLMAIKAKVLENPEQTEKPYSLKKAGREAARKAETDLIRKALTDTRWNRKKTAKLLRISYKALLYKMKECELNEDGPIIPF